MAFCGFLFCVLRLVSTCPGLKFGSLGRFGFVVSVFGVLGWNLRLSWRKIEFWWVWRFRRIFWIGGFWVLVVCDFVLFLFDCL